MKIEEAITILKTHNEWRRGADIPMTDPKILGEAIDCVVEEYGQEPSDEMIMRILNCIGYEEESWIGFVRQELEKRKELPTYNATYLQSKIDAHTKRMQENGLTSDKMLEECRGGNSLTWHKVSDGDLPKDRIFLAHCAGMGKGYVDRIIWNDRNGGFDNLNDMLPSASIKESHFGDYYDLWMEIPEIQED